MVGRREEGRKEGRYNSIFLIKQLYMRTYTKMLTMVLCWNMEYLFFFVYTFYVSNWWGNSAAGKERKKRNALGSRLLSTLSAAL